MTRKPGAPDHSVRGVAHGYWIEKRERRLAAKAQRRKGASHKPQAHKLLDKPLDLWDKAI